MNEILIEIGIATLLRVLKSKTERSKWRDAMLKVYRKIGEAYASDPDFQALASSPRKPGD